MIGLLSRLCGGSDEKEFKCYEYGHDWREGGTEWRANGFDIDKENTKDWSHFPPSLRENPTYVTRVKFVRRKQCHTCGRESWDVLRIYDLSGNGPEDAPTLLEEDDETAEEVEDE